MTDLTTLSADPHNNTLGQHLRKLWDATRATGQVHGVWRPALGRFITMDELKEMEEIHPMTTAHGTRHVYAGATRHADIGPTVAVATTFFAELHPHLNDIRAIAPTNVEIAHGYLLRRGAQTPEKIATKLGFDPTRDRSKLLRILEGEPDLFRKAGRNWEAIPQTPKERADRRLAEGGNISQRIIAYLAECDATPREIEAATGIDNRTAAQALARGCGAIIVGERKEPGKRPSNVWGVR